MENDNKTKALLEYTALTVINNTLFKNGLIDERIKDNIEKNLRRDYRETSI